MSATSLITDVPPGCSPEVRLSSRYMAGHSTVRIAKANERVGAQLMVNGPGLSVSICDLDADACEAIASMLIVEAARQRAVSAKLKAAA